LCYCSFPVYYGFPTAGQPTVKRLLGRPENIWNMLLGMALECHNSEKKKRRKIKRSMDELRGK
jgi:hypothetical protein